MSDMAPAGVGVAWKVVTTVPTTGFDISGKAVPGRNVTYQTSTGVTGTVFIPSTVTDTAAQKDMIGADAARATSLQNLTSSS